MARHRGRYSPKRRAIYAKGDDINALELFNRHNWICNICGEAIDPKKRFPSPYAATVEHIIPISKGGEHVWDNCRPAHGICNFIKSDQMPYEGTDGSLAV